MMSLLYLGLKFPMTIKRHCCTSLPLGTIVYLFAIGSANSFLPNQSYSVIFDANTYGIGVRVFASDHQLHLVPIANYLHTTDPKAEYAKDPEAAANSLLAKAKSVVGKTPPVRTWETAGLIHLGGDTSDRILRTVGDVLEKKSSLNSKSNAADSVNVLDWKHEGAYQWVTLNYLLGNLGKGHGGTVGVIDLVGAYVQMAYAISESKMAYAISKSPKLSDEEYIQQMYLNGTKYYLFVHSYLRFGLLEARAEILKADESDNPCILERSYGFDDKNLLEEQEDFYSGFDDKYLLEEQEDLYSVYKYGVQYHTTFGSRFGRCRLLTLELLRHSMDYAFAFIWNRGRGDGYYNFLATSFFFDRAVEAGMVDEDVRVAKISPSDFSYAARRACQTKLEHAKSLYPRVKPDDLPYLCMDLTHQFVLLVDVFNLDTNKEITLVKKVKYENIRVEAAWPLDSAIEASSSPW